MFCLKWVFLCVNLSIHGSFSQGLGTDEETLIEILASRNNREILDIKKTYKEGACQQILSNKSSVSSSSCLEIEVMQHVTVENYSLWDMGEGLNIQKNTG